MFEDLEMANSEYEKLKTKYDELVIAKNGADEKIKEFEEGNKNYETIEKIAKLIDEYDSLIVAYENEKDNTIKEELLQLKEKLQEKRKINIALVIGPEGGLEENDVQVLKENGAKIVTLGNRILRTETVALNVLSIIMYELEN